MRVLLDTNVVIHREASYVVKKEIGGLFYWLDQLNYEKCIHPKTIQEIRRHKDAKLVQTFEAKLDSYVTLKTLAVDTKEIKLIRANYDRTPNDEIDTDIIRELFANRVAFLITEDRKMHSKAEDLGISERIFTIDAFLEKVIAENPSLVDYSVLSVRKEHFGNIDLDDLFFDSFKSDYPDFAVWFNKKADKIAYICEGEDKEIVAFLYVKVESLNENYQDIEPVFKPKKRLKIGTFKVTANGFKLGERFLKIIFDNAMQYHVEEIYVTIFDDTEEKRRLIKLLMDWGFEHYGIKKSQSGIEQVYVRDFVPKVDTLNPMRSYPFLSKQTRKFIVPIYPEYHTELFPDSILRTESPDEFVENRPNRNAINKVYISRSLERGLKSGDVVVFYRTKYKGPAYHTSVATTVGVIGDVFIDIESVDEFIKLCRKRSVFSDDELEKHWHHNPKNRPFIVNFLYVFSFTLGNRLNLKALKNEGIIDKAPRGFEEISDDSFQRLMEKSNADMRFIID